MAHHTAESRHFKDTWPAFQGDVDLSRIDTDVFRVGWPKPTIYREHEVIHVMANIIDKLIEAQGGQNHAKSSPE